MVRNVDLLLPMTTWPLPEITNSHCSLVGCSLAISSSLVAPGASVILAACTDRERRRMLNSPRFAAVAMCFMVVNLWAML